MQVSEPTDYLYYNALFHKQVGSVTEKEADAAIGALQNIEYVKPMRNAYKMIILEEAQAYFTGNRDLDGVCNNIENRLRLALEENKQ